MDTEWLYEYESLDSEVDYEEVPVDYHVRTYNLHKYLWGFRTEDIKHQRQYADFLGVKVRDLNYDEDYILVGTFVPNPPVEDKRKLPEYREWRSKVFKRDNYTCQECGSKRNLQAHHIRQVALYPDLVYELSNGITLCKTCHREIPTARRNA